MKPAPMNRLLQGDVDQANRRCALRNALALKTGASGVDGPTEILAEQHALTFESSAGLGVRTAVIEAADNRTKKKIKGTLPPAVI